MPTGAHTRTGSHAHENGQISGFLCSGVGLYGLRGETPKYGTFYKNNQQGRRGRNADRLNVPPGIPQRKNANRRRRALLCLLGLLGLINYFFTIFY